MKNPFRPQIDPDNMGNIDSYAEKHGFSRTEAVNRMLKHVCEPDEPESVEGKDEEQ